jgi:hypothetical protein
MGPGPSSTGASEKDRQLSFSLSITFLRSAALVALMLTPTMAKGLSASFLTSDRSWGHRARHTGQYWLQKSSSTTFPR